MNRNLFLFSLLFVFALAQPLAAQTDTLLQVYKKTKDFKTRLDAGNDLIFALRFDNKPLAKQIARTLLANKKIAGFPEAHARTWIRLGIVYDLSNKPDSAILCNENALSIASVNDLGKQKASALNNLGLIYWNYHQLDKATDCITKACTEFEKNKDTSNMANALNNLGLIMNEFTQRKKAAVYHRKALALFKLVHDDYGIGSALHNISFSQTDPDSAKYYYYKTIAWQTRINDHYGLGKSYHDLAMFYNNTPDSAIKYYELAIVYQRKSGNIYGEASTLGTTASFLFVKLGDTQKSLAMALESARISQEMGYVRYFWKAEAILGNIYFKRKEYKDAAFHFRRALNLKDSVMNEETFKTSQQLELKYNVAQKEKQLAEQKVDIANKKNQIVQGESERKTILITLIVIVFAAVFLLGIVAWYFNRRRLRSQKAHAQQLAEEREKSLQQTLVAQEEERQRIAKDLHDGIVQDLAAIKMNLDQVWNFIPAEQRPGFETVKNNLEKTTKEVRDISHQMMPTALRELGLVAALEDNLQRVLPLHNIKHEFYAHGIKGRLPEKIEISLYRIAQELINNVIRHSKASQVSVSLTLINGFVTMHFEDNGKGFDMGKKSTGIGLTNLQSRVRIVNGEIKYESGENSGTVAIIKVPV